MPIFTTEATTHPVQLASRCFAVDVMLPRLDEESWVVEGYISEEFQRCVVSRELAERLGFKTTDSEAAGEVVIETRYDNGPMIHRSSPMALTFRIAHPKVGPGYIHFSLDELEPYLSAERHDPEDPGEKSFLAFRPVKDPTLFCHEIPMERLGFTDLGTDPS